MKYTVKNFKIFDEKGVTFDIAPITMLTGCNSSGKSSLVKSMMVLGDYLRKVKSYLNTVSKDDQTTALEQTVDFALGEKNTGGFDNVLNDRNTNGRITFQYSVYSKWLLDEVTVTLEFEKDSEDALGRNGKLYEATFQLSDGTVFYQTGHGDKGEIFHRTIDLAAIQNSFMKMASAAAIKRVEDEIHALDEYFDDPSLFGSDSVEHYDSEIRREKELQTRLAWLKSNLERDITSVKLPKTYQVVFNDLLEENVTNDDIIAMQKYKTVFYQPWLKLLDGVSKEQTRAAFYKALQNVDLSVEAKNNLDFVLDDFENSKFDYFIDYYRNLEKSKLCNTAKADYRGLSQFDVVFGYHLSGYASKSVKGRVAIDYINRMGGNTVLYPSTKEERRGPVHFLSLFFILGRLYNIVDPEYAKRKYFSEKCMSDDPENEFGHSYEMFRNSIFKAFQKFINCIWMELLVDDVPAYFSNLLHLGSNRAVPQRLYSFDNVDSELTQNLKVYLELKNEFPKVIEMAIEHFSTGHKKTKSEVEELKKLKKESSSFMETWLRKFEICDSFRIETIKSNGVLLGCSVCLVKRGKKYSIVDEGYGCVQIFSVLLAVQIAIFKSIISIINKGTDEKYVLAIEEPENHLHPKLQSLLADMFEDATTICQFIVETHSEYLIRKSQVLVKKWYEENKDATKKCPFNTYYIPANGEPYSLGYRKDGKFAESFGSGFYDESANLTFEIM